MPRQSRQLISIVVPCFNESGNILDCLKALTAIADNDPRHDYEFIFVDDGSHDDTDTVIRAAARTDKRVHGIVFTRNFGKEIALTAGLVEACGKAIITVDADGQHPYDMIPEFIERWRNGSRLIIGVRRNEYTSSWKNFSSRLFYKLFNGLSDSRLQAGATDFRLIDRAVRDEFVKFKEASRMSRSLIDWLGFSPDYIKFDMAERQVGTASYNYRKLTGLAINSFVSLSLRPLYVLAYTGSAILVLSAVLAIFSAVEMLIGDPLGLKISGTAYLVMLVLFLLGVIMISQGILALYISHIHIESKGRPLYIVDHTIGTTKK